RELLAPYLRQGEFALKHLIFGDVFLGSGIGHDRSKDRHLVADGGVADATIDPLAIFLTPERISEPAVLGDQIYLYGTDIAVELRPDDGFDVLPSGWGDLSGLGALLLEINEVLGDLAEGAIEDRNVVLDAKAEIRVLIEGPLARGIDVGGLQANRLVAVRIRQLDPAIPIPVFHVGLSEDDEAGLEFLSVEEECHLGDVSVQILCYVFS